MSGRFFTRRRIKETGPCPVSTVSNARRRSRSAAKTYTYFSLPAAEKNGLKGISRLPNSLKILLENLLRYEDGRTVTADDIKAVAGWLKTKTLRPRDRLPARARADAGFHRRACRRRSRRHARCDEGDERRPREDQPARACRSRHRPLGDSRFLHRQGCVQEERRDGIRPQRRALFLPALGPAGLRSLPRRAARHRHLPSGQSRISRPDRVDRQGQGRKEDRRIRLSRHAGRHRFPHHDDQRPLRARLGRRRHRSGSRDARTADLDADPRSHRHALLRQTCARA